MFPTLKIPSAGTFVEQQIAGLRETGMEVELMLVDRAGKGMRAYLGLGQRVCVRVDECRPDLVHVMYGGVMADAVTRAVTSRPTVVSFCGSDLFGEVLSGPARKVISKYGVFASRRAARRASGIVVKSKNLQRALPGDVNPSKVKIIPNGINLERFKVLDRASCQNRLGWNSREFHVLFPANSGDPCKRPDLAHAAVKVLSRENIPVNFHELRGVPHDQVPIWLNASNALLLTSLHEGSPNVVKEALACDLPVVCVDVGDVRERIGHIEGCYLSAPDARDLAAKLQKVYVGPGRVASRRSVEGLSLRNVALRLKEFYVELLQSSSHN